MPVISWSGAGLDILKSIVGGMGIAPDMLDGGLAILQNMTAESPLGVSLSLPGAAAVAPEVDFSAEPTLATLEGSAPATQIGAVLSDGKLQAVAGVDAAALGALGIQIPDLPADVVNIINNLDASQLQIIKTDSGLLIQADGQSLLALTYTEGSLLRAVDLASAVTNNPDLSGMVAEYLPALTGHDLMIQVGLKGGESPVTRLADMPVTIEKNGSLSIFGIDLGLGSILPAGTVEQLQAVNIQQLNVNIVGNDLYLGINGEELPVIAWSDQSLPVIQTLLGSVLNVSPDLLGLVIGLIRGSDVGLQLQIPPAEGTAVVEVPAEFDVTQVTFEAPDLSNVSQPMLRVPLVFEGSRLTQVGDLSGDALEAFGVPAVDLPPNVVSILKDDLGANSISITTEINGLNITADEQMLLSLRYDGATLQNILQLVAPLLPAETASLLGDASMEELLQDHLLPLLIGADVNITATLQ